MDRRKIAKVDVVNLVEPLTWHKKDGTEHPVKRLTAVHGHSILERDGQCYVVYNISGYPCFDGLLFAIKEKFDDIEGKEIKAGGDASENEGVRPVD